MTVMNLKGQLNIHPESRRCCRNLHPGCLGQGGCLFIWTFGAGLLAFGGRQWYLVIFISPSKCFMQKVALTPFVPSPKESWAEYAGASSCDRSWSYHMQHVSHLAAGFQHPDCTLTMLTLGCAHVGPADGLTRQSPRTEQSQPLQNQPAQPSGQAGARPSHQQPASAQLSNALSLGPS